MKAGLFVALIAMGLPLSASAQALNVQGQRYLCDRDVEVPVVFVTGPEDAVAVLQIDGFQILLYQEPAASGSKYSWPSGGASYVLWTKGDEATLYWREGGVETQFMACKATM